MRTLAGTKRRKASGIAKQNKTKPKKMTKNQFNSLCAIRYIDPSMALENENIIEALQNGGDVQEIEEILENEF
jgi:hypothetical protein